MYTIDVYMMSPVKNDSIAVGESLELKIILKDNQMLALGIGKFTSVFNEATKKYMQCISVVVERKTIEAFVTNPIIEVYGKNYCNIKYTAKAIKDEIKMIKKFLSSKFSFS